MKNNRNGKVFLLLGLSLLVLGGCGSRSDTASSSAETAADISVSSYSDPNPDSVNENITTSSNYYEEPAEAADTGDAEGYIPENIPEGTVAEAELGEEVTFTENGSEAYAVTIQSAELTDRRSVVPEDDAEQVLLITYSYRSLNDEPCLVDDMSFRLFAGDAACDSYYVSDQISGDISTGDAVTAEVSFSLPADVSEYTLYLVDNAEEDNEIWRFNIQL